MLLKNILSLQPNNSKNISLFDTWVQITKKSNFGLIKNLQREQHFRYRTPAFFRPIKIKINVIVESTRSAQSLIKILFIIENTVE